MHLMPLNRHLGGHGDGPGAGVAVVLVLRVDALRQEEHRVLVLLRPHPAMDIGKAEG